MISHILLYCVERSCKKGTDKYVRTVKESENDEQAEIVIVVERFSSEILLNHALFEKSMKLLVLSIRINYRCGEKLDLTSEDRERSNPRWPPSILPNIQVPIILVVEKRLRCHFQLNWGCSFMW